MELFSWLLLVVDDDIVDSKRSLLILNSSSKGWVRGGHRFQGACAIVWARHI